MPKANMLLVEGVNSRPAIASVIADQDAAEERARHGAQSAGDDDDEGQKCVARPERRRCIDQQHHHCAGGADASGAESERERVEALDVEPDYQRAGMVVGAGADRRPDEREAKE